MKKQFQKLICAALGAALIVSAICVVAHAEASAKESI